MNTNNMSSSVSDAFYQKYHRKPSCVAFTPYRICPLGAHVDHNHGLITGFAIDKGIYMAYGPKANGVVEISSLQFPKRAQWHVNNTPEKVQGDWADLLRGATLALNKRFILRVGLSAIIDGELPIGGISSSAAVIITYLSALCTLNNISLSSKDMIDIAQEAENNYVGVHCGRLDQSCEVYSRKDKLLFLDTQNEKHQLIAQPDNMKDYAFLVLFSGVERSLASSKYNMRVDEAKSAAYALKAYAGMEYGKFEDTYLRDVPYEVFEQYKDKLPENFAKRAYHFYTENQRVLHGVEAWKRGDIEAFGKLCFESGKSSIENWETGSDELIKLYELMTQTKGVYGGRFLGAGFKGCCLAIVDPAFIDSISQSIAEGYIQAFPHLKDKFSIHVCYSADGVRL